MPLRVLAFVTIAIGTLVLLILAGYGVTGATRDLPATCLEDANCIALADLDAQRSMAWAAWSMFGAALLSIILTIVGAVLLLQNLAESRRASRYAAFNVAAARRTNRHALRSALAAESALVASSTNAQRQLRAYLHLQSATLLHMETLRDEPSDEIPTIKVTIKNTGQTPAKNIRHLATCAIGGKNRDADDLTFKYVPGEEHLNAGDIGAGGTRKLSIPLHPQQVAYLKLYKADYSDQLSLYCYGEIMYADVFGQEYILRFRTKLLALTDHRFYICDAGNGEETLP